MTMSHRGLSRRAAMAGVAGLSVAPAFTCAAAVNGLTDGAAVRPLALRQAATVAARPAQAVLQAVTRAGRGPRLVAVGERGLVLWSDDGGQAWKQASVPVSCTLTALRFVDERRGWAVGNLGVVLETLDGGETWTRRLDGTQGAALALEAARKERTRTDAKSRLEGEERLLALTADAERLVEEGADKPLLDLAVRPDGSMLVVGAYGLAFTSSDGGRQWQSQMHRLPNPDGLSYYGLVERSGERILFGEQGLLLHADGPAGDFRPRTPLAGGSLFGGLTLREGTALLLGLRGKLWRSAAPGGAWALVQTPVDAALVCGLQLEGGTVLAAGAAGQLLASDDGGQHFRALRIARRFPFTGLAQAHDGGLVMVGMRGLLRMSPAELRQALAERPAPAPAKAPRAATGPSARAPLPRTLS